MRRVCVLLVVVALLSLLSVSVDARRHHRLREGAEVKVAAPSSPTSVLAPVEPVAAPAANAKCLAACAANCAVCIAQCKKSSNFFVASDELHMTCREGCAAHAAICAAACALKDEESVPSESSSVNVVDSSNVVAANPVVAPMINGKCLAVCAANAALCVSQCKKSTLLGGAVDQLTMTCREGCAAHAAICAAGCALKEEEEPVPSVPELTAVVESTITTTAADASVEAPAVNAKCLAVCAANAALCVHQCGKSSGLLTANALRMTCKEGCAAHAAICAGSCVLKEEDHPTPSAAVIDSSNVEAALAEITAPVAVEAPAINGKCLAGCAAHCAVCIAQCKKSTLLGADELTMTCRESCAASAAICAAACALKDEQEQQQQPEEVDAQLASDRQQFASFKQTFGRKYETESLEAHRFSIFRSNLRKAEELSRRVPSATFGVTQFSDLHPVEFKRQYLTFRPAVGDAAVLRKGVPVTVTANSSLPSKYDWRRPDGGRPVGITAVKDQGQCGSCWAFSATEALESAWILKGHPAVELSPEQTVDCDTVDQGCNGGDTVTAYAYMKKTGGVMSEKAYPYQAGLFGQAGTCQFKASQVQAKLTGFTYATPGCSDSCTKQDEAKLKESLYHVGPVSICVDASPWQTYVSGILTPDAGCNSGYDQLDHCVQLVGYGVDNGQEFWTVRNSWATTWGEAGYIRLSYGTNTCGVADEATQVTV